MRQRRCIGLVFAVALLLAMPRPGRAYIEAPFTLGRICNESTNILVMRIESVDRQKNLIVYRKVRDLKGTHPGEVIRHNIARAGFNPREWQNVMAWAEVGKTAVFFHNGGAGEVCIDHYWYQAYAGEWWSMSHAEPFLLRSFCGRPSRLITSVQAMLAGQEVVVPCMVDGDKNALHLRTARLQRLRASLKLVEYDTKRDFAGWGVEEFSPLVGLPGFTHQAPLANVGPSAIGIAAGDFDGDGKSDFCLYGPTRLSLLHNESGSPADASPGLDGGARGASWADFDGDGRADLLLATPTGPRLFSYDGKAFADLSSRLPTQGYWNLTAAAWIDYDGDKRPDILLADGFAGLRLYRNVTGEPVAGVKRMGPWFYAGPFDNSESKGFDAVYPPEKGVDLKAKYTGKNNEPVTWQEGTKFVDGQVNDLLIFKPECNENAAVYLYRRIECGAATELPVSLGSDDTLTVWLNGEKVLAQNEYRGCAPDQALLTLKLRPGGNDLLLKVCQGAGGWGFYFAAKEPTALPPLFADVSDHAGLGADGAGGRLGGDRLAVADVNGDGRPDVLYSGGTGLLLLNTGKGFAAAADSGIRFRAGGVTPLWGDYDGDKRVDLFVPQAGGCRLFRNEGGGRFRDVTASAGDLGRDIGRATSAVGIDLDRNGRPGLMVGCLRGPNRYFRNNGNGTFTDASESLGLLTRIFNTQALATVDVNHDGTPDLVLNNEGQDSAVLLGDPARLGPPTAAR
ncbi:MAG: hypothetical protein BIFFINMI_03170 [Phycisphaerae bacterium]|nr:hypothetical protein [Phycisphaerae bacterium]